MSKENKCLGCGVEKQITDNSKLGYVLSLEHSYCTECHKLKNYGIVSSHVHPESLPEIKSGSLVLIIQSVMQLDRLFTQPIIRIQPNAKYVHIINQVDLLPHDTNINHLYSEIFRTAKDNNVPLEDIVFMSAINKDDINNLKEYILSFNQKDVYLFGIQNSGKTTIFKGVTNNTNALAINKAGLTQNIITDQLEDKTIYDMPGTYQGGYLHDFLPYERYKKLIPSKTIKPLVYQMSNHQGLVLEDFISLSYRGSDTTFVLYLSNFTNVQKLNTVNLDKKLSNDYQYIIKNFKASAGKHQITFGDLGFMHITGPITMTVKLPKSMHVTISGSYFK